MSQSKFFTDNARSCLVLHHNLARMFVQAPEGMYSILTQPTPEQVQRFLSHIEDRMCELCECYLDHNHDGALYLCVVCEHCQSQYILKVQSVQEARMLMYQFQEFTKDIKFRLV